MVRILKANWFYLLLPPLLLAAWSLSISPEATADPHTLERVYLFDFLITLPLLYFLFLRTRVSRRVAVIRAAALAGSGVWLASALLPDGTGQILPWLAWLRYIALPVLILVELVAVVAVMRHVYGREPSETYLMEQGMPPILAKALLAEARFWRRVWSWFRRN